MASRQFYVCQIVAEHRVKNKRRMESSAPMSFLLLYAKDGYGMHTREVVSALRAELL